MKYRSQLPGNALAAAVLVTALSHCALAQSAPPDDAQTHEAKGIPARATPADYQTHAQAGPLTVAAEFTGHSVPTPQGVFSTEDYVAVEVALFGPPATRTRLSYEDFSLRINGKKTPLAAQPYALVFRSLKDPEWAPPEPAEKKSKGGINSGGNSDQGSPPPVVHMPIGVERAMEQKVQKAALPEGERMLPEAGLIFFEHRGKSTSIELIYAGPAGKATLTLQP